MITMSVLIKQLIVSFMATCGFGVLFKVPKNALVYSGLCGSFAWVVSYIITNHFNRLILGAFVGAIVVGVLGEILAKKYKKPVTIYIISGIIPLVPGSGTYYTLYYLVNREDALYYENLYQTIGVALAISIGVLVSSLLSKSLNHTHKKSSSF